MKNTAEEYIKSKFYEDLTWTEEVYIEDAFKAGFAVSKKIILDTLNRYKSLLQQESLIKPSKVRNVEKETSYRNYIEVLEILLSK